MNPHTAVVDPARLALDEAVIRFRDTEFVRSVQRRDVMYARLAMRDRSAHRPKPRFFGGALMLQILSEQSPPDARAIQAVAQPGDVKAKAESAVVVDVALGAT